MSPPRRAWNLNRHNVGGYNPGLPPGVPGNWSQDYGNRMGHLAFQSTGNQIPNNNNTSGGGDGNGGSQQCGGPPPIPPRPDQQQVPNMGMNRYGLSNNYGSYGGYSSYSPYSYSNQIYGSVYGGLSAYGNRFGYGGVAGDYYPNGGDNFFRMAEESSRQAFQSIESIVQAFGSVSMMLESTYHAVYSSFRAVIGVADHFSRLKDHLAQILSTLAIIRSLRWLFRKALYILKLSHSNPAYDGAWSAASKAASSETLEEMDLKRSRSSWPIMMFFGVVLGAPYLIWKLLSSVEGGKPSDKWKTGEDTHYEACAKYDFNGENPKELSFRSGQKLILAPKPLQPKIRGWLLASVDGAKTGLVPGNYIKITGLKQAKEISSVSPTLNDSIETSNEPAPHASTSLTNLEPESV